MNADLEKLRKAKDAEIMKLKDEAEASRLKYEGMIKDKCEIIKNLTTMKLQSDSEILALNALLK